QRDLKRTLHGLRGSDLIISSCRRGLDIDNALEYFPEDIAVAEATVAIDRECRVVRNSVVEIEPAEPTVGKVQLNLLARPSLKADAVAVTHNQHPDHQFRVDRGPPDFAIEGRLAPQSD